jgi:RNA polymerase sigma-70 factor (ECF subfamily)
VKPRFFRQRPSELADEELLERYRRDGRLGELSLLYQRYVELVYGVCLRYLGREDEAEDAVMAIFEELVEKVIAHDIHNFRSWLYVLAKNHCLMGLRKQQRDLTIPYEPGFVQLPEHSHPLVEESEDNGREAQLRDCLEKLPDQQRRCVELFYYQGKSYKDIAGLLSEDLGKVRSHIQNGRRNLRLCIERRIEQLEGGKAETP